MQKVDYPHRHLLDTMKVIEEYASKTGNALGLTEMRVESGCVLVQLETPDDAAIVRFREEVTDAACVQFCFGAAVC